VPYEVTINITPQTRIDGNKILKEVKLLRDNPFSVDKIHLNKESCQIKKKYGGTLHIKKGEKLIRSLRQILTINYEKLRSKLSMVRAV